MDSRSIMKGVTRIPIHEIVQRHAQCPTATYNLIVVVIVIIWAIWICISWRTIVIVRTSSLTLSLTLLYQTFVLEDVACLLYQFAGSRIVLFAAAVIWIVAIWSSIGRSIVIWSGIGRSIGVWSGIGRAIVVWSGVGRAIVVWSGVGRAKGIWFFVASAERLWGRLIAVATGSPTCATWWAKVICDTSFATWSTRPSPVVVSVSGCKAFSTSLAVWWAVAILVPGSSVGRAKLVTST